MDAGVTLWTLPLTALSTGFLGSLHCIGMCGGVSGTIALAAPLQKPTTPNFPVAVSVVATHRATNSASRPETNVLAFNAGRIGSYMIAGAMTGSIGGLIGQGWVMSETMTARTVLFLFANLMIVATGLTLMGLPQLLAPLERAGGVIWRHISPLTRKLLPINTVPRATMFGVLWGWIPCGMVYAMLLSSMGAGSAVAGLLTMLAFGMGTLPAMIASGWAAGRLRQWTRDSRVRMAAGAAIVAMGLFGFARADGLKQLESFGAFCVSALAPASPAPVTGR